MVYAKSSFAPKTNENTFIRILVQMKTLLGSFQILPTLGLFSDWMIRKTVKTLKILVYLPQALLLSETSDNSESVVLLLSVSQFSSGYLDAISLDIICLFLVKIYNPKLVSITHSQCLNHLYHVCKYWFQTAKVKRKIFFIFVVLIKTLNFFRNHMQFYL